MKITLRALLILIVGLWVWWQFNNQLRHDLPPALESLDLTLIGRVVDLPRAQGKLKLRFILDVTSAHNGNIETDFSGRVYLTWYRNFPPLHAGELWHINARLKARHGFANPGGFDYEKALFRRGILARGSVRNKLDNHRLAPAAMGILPLREIVRDRLSSRLPKTPGTGLILALVLGDTSHIDAEHWTILNRAGLNHLVAISGLHIGIIGSLGFLLLLLIWRCSAALCAKLAAPKAAAIGGIFFAWGYAALAGYSVSTLRALGMLAALQGALLLGRNPRPFNGFILAVLLVLLIDPLAIFSSGFWLSFGAVGILFYGLSGRLQTTFGWTQWLWLWGRAQWLIFVGLSPLLALLFGQLSLLAPLVNVWLIPIFSLFLPLLLATTALALFSNWFMPLEILVWLLDLGMNGLQVVVAYPWVMWTFPAVPLWVWLCAFMGTSILLLPKGLPGRWAGIPLILALWLWQPMLLSFGSFHLTLLDVGQGLAAVVQTHNHSLVYDTGPIFPSGFNTGTAVLVPTLRAYGIKRVDRVIISHGDQDHAGGLLGLLAQVPVTEILSGEPARLPSTIDASIQQCVVGQAWIWDGVHFEILAPHTPLSIISNDRSCILRVAGPGGSLLFMGDLGGTAETILTARMGKKLQSQVLIAGHHGSATATSERFLAQVRPELVLVSAGYRNRFRFPRPQMVKRVTQTGAKLATTSNSGALKIRFDANKGLQGPFAYRNRHAWPWTHQPTLRQ